jgi:cytochrome c
VVSFNEAGLPIKIEPFMPDIPVSKPIDMEFGPEGALYYLEYGANYFAENDEAKLVKIEYTEGNRKPVADIKVSTKAGGAPLTVNFSALGSFDHDQNDKLTYEWNFGGDEVQSDEAEAVYTFEEPGIYTPSLIVTDNHGNTTTEEIEVKVGNAPPEIEITFKGNQSFFYDDVQLQYNIQVTDPEDGSTRNNTIDPSMVKLSFDYLRESKDLALLGNSARVSAFLKGKYFIDGSDCKSCHDMEEKSIGPSYIEIAERYHGEPGITPVLANKIIAGGSGNWGHSLMAAHPQLSEEEAGEMVKYILSLADEATQDQITRALEGAFALDKHDEVNESGTYFLAVSYTDQGANKMPPITTRKMVTLQNPKVQAEAYEDFKNVSRQRPQGGAFAYVGDIRDGSYMVFKDIDLTDITELIYRIGVRADAKGGTISLRLDSPSGEVVSKKVFTEELMKDGFNEVSAEVTPTEGVHDLYFVFNHEEEKDNVLFNLDWIYFEQNQNMLP